MRDSHGRKYLDLVAARGKLNTGHNHPALVQVLAAGPPAISPLPEFTALAKKLFDFNTIVPLSSGSEAYNFIVKAAKKWGAEEKRIPENKAVILVAPGSHCGSVIPVGIAVAGHQPPILKYLPFDSIECLEAELMTNSNVVGYLMDTVKWSNGVEVWGRKHLEEVRRTCSRHGVLWILDETFSGLGRTGYLLGHVPDRAEPDIVVMSNTLGAGLHPVSIVMGREEVVGRNCVSEVRVSKLGLRVALETLRVVQRHHLPQNALAMGRVLRSALTSTLHPEEMPQLKGRGLLTALRIHGGIGHAFEICELMKMRGVLAWPCSTHYVGVTPPLTINEEQIHVGVSALANSIDALLQKHMENGRGY